MRTCEYCGQHDCQCGKEDYHDKEWEKYLEYRDKQDERDYKILRIIFFPWVQIWEYLSQ